MGKLVLLFLLSTGAFATLKQVYVVIDLESTLVTRVADKTATSIKTDLIFGSPIHFAPNQHYADLIQFLNDRRPFVVSYLWREDQKRMRKVLKEVTASGHSKTLLDLNRPYLENDDFTNVYSRSYEGTPRRDKRDASKIQRKPHDLRKLRKIITQVLVITKRTESPVLDDDVNRQADHILTPPKGLSGNDEFYWLIGAIYDIKQNRWQHSAMRDMIGEVMSSPLHDLIRVGKGLHSSPDWQEITYRPIISENEVSAEEVVTGCLEINHRTLVNTETEMDQCLRRYTSQYYWLSVARKKCGHFLAYSKGSSKFYFLEETKAEKCHDRSHISYWHQDSKQWLHVEYFAGIEAYDLQEITSNDVLINIATNFLASDFMAWSKKLTRDVFVYNWRRLDVLDVDSEGDLIEFEKDESVSLTDERILRYANTWRDAVFNFNASQGGEVGWGLYAANNPYRSAGYGASFQFLLTEIKLPQNSRIIETRQEDTFPMSRKTGDFISKHLGCWRPRYYNHLHDGINYHRFDKRRFVTRKNCFKVFTQAIKTAKIAASVYGWTAGKRLSPACDIHDRKIGLVILETPLDETTVRGFVDTLHESDPPEKIDAYSIMAQSVLQHAGATELQQFSNWNFPTNYQHQAPIPLQNLFNCSKNRPEDSQWAPNDSKTPIVLEDMTPL